MYGVNDPSAAPAISPSVDALQSAIQARHIMTVRSQFVAGKDADDALALLLDEKNRDLDLIPFPNGRDPIAYVLRLDRRPHNIDRDHLISDSTPVIELVKYFDDGREVLFVLSGNQISGLVHLSDLNSSLCKIAFFTLLNNVERACLDVFRSGLPEPLTPPFTERQSVSIKGRVGKWRANDALPFDAAALYFEEALKLIQTARLPSLTDDEITWLKKARDHTAHAGHLLYSKMADLAQLKAVVSICERVLNELRVQYGTT